MQDHVSTMQPVQQVAIPPHRSLSFAAGGYHIMLEHATRSLQPGDRVSMTLRFADGSTSWTCHLTCGGRMRTARDDEAPPLVAPRSGARMQHRRPDSTHR